MPDARRTSPGGTFTVLSSFIGRQRELTEIRAVLTDARLVTLTGTGGTGKTRLALQTAARGQRTFRDGVWFVDLSQLSEVGGLGPDIHQRDTLASVVLADLGLAAGDGASLRRLISFLAERHALLVLDNCEHLLPACAQLVHALLRGCPALRVLATSREPLAINGEVLYEVPPLPVPDPDGRSSLAELALNESVALFLARAQAGLPTFDLTEENRDGVARLCHRLEGLPLAIELAAARIRVLTPEQILDRLADRFALLSRGARTAPTRQQTLQGCVEWSFDLCTKPERLLWARLSVFAGGFELDAAEAVCGDGWVLAGETLTLLASLVEKSVLAATPLGETMRYRMLETLREFGQQQLFAIGEQITLRHRHRDWCLDLVDRVGAEWVSDQQRRWYPRLGREHANLRVAAEFCLTEAEEAGDAIRIVAALPALYWWGQGLTGQALHWLEDALEMVTEPTVLRAQGLLRAGYMAIWHRDADTVAQLVDQGEALAERLDDRLGLAFAACVRGTVANQHGDSPAAAEIFENALRLLPDDTDPEPVLTLRLEAMFGLGAAALVAGQLDTSVRTYQEIIDITTARGEAVWRSYALLLRGRVAWRSGVVADARRYVMECLRVAREYDTDDRFSTTAVEILAWIACRTGQHLRAATLLGAANTLLSRRHMRPAAYRMLATDHEACERQVRQALGEAEFSTAFHHGSTLPVPDMFSYALDEQRRPDGQPATRAASASSLTRREREIAEHVARGLPNQEIATSLFLSRRTVESHVEHILAKLDFTSRAQVAAWIAAQQPPDLDA